MSKLNEKQMSKLQEDVADVFEEWLDEQIKETLFWENQEKFVQMICTVVNLRKSHVVTRNKGNDLLLKVYSKPVIEEVDKAILKVLMSYENQQ